MPKLGAKGDPAYGLVAQGCDNVPKLGTKGDPGSY